MRSTSLEPAATLTSNTIDTLSLQTQCIDDISDATSTDLLTPQSMVAASAAMQVASVATQLTLDEGVMDDSMQQSLSVNCAASSTPASTEATPFVASATTLPASVEAPSSASSITYTDFDTVSSSTPDSGVVDLISSADTTDAPIVSDVISVVGDAIKENSTI